MAEKQLPKMRVRDLAIFCVFLVGTVAIFNAGAGAWISDQQADPTIEHEPYVVGLAKAPSLWPEPITDRSMLLLVGNSHSFGLPGLKRGEALRPETSGTLLYELARDVDASVGNDCASYYRVSYPNYLPFEVLTTLENLKYRGYHPKVVVMGWTWTNFCRQRDLRYDIYTLFQNPDFVSWFRKELATLDPAEVVEITAAIDAEVRKAKAEVEENHQQSDADKLDDKVIGTLGEYITLIGQSDVLRARFYLNVTNILQDAIVHSFRDYQHRIVESDLEFNLKCMRAELQLLKARGVTVLIYHTPMRTDLPPVVENIQREGVMDKLSKYATDLGFHVIDASLVVPNEYWGWSDYYPDRAHFVEPGHKLLAKFLFDHGAEQHVWDALRRAPEKNDKSSTTEGDSGR